jgi:hypothetical protein
MGVLLAVFVVAGVAAAAVPALAAEPPDPCVLITTVDASTALGGTPGKPKAKTVGPSRSCTYTVKRRSLTVATRALSSQAVFDRNAKAGRGIVVPIDGIGADAWSANGTTLLLWKSGTEITVTFVGVTPFVATQQSLAKTALGRL